MIGTDGKQLGVLQLGEALNLARASGVDLVEIAANATPPVCRLVDFGKYRYEQAKRDKIKKHQHANKVKGSARPKIDPTISASKSNTRLIFSGDMKVKITLKFRGREMAHTGSVFKLLINSSPKLLPSAIPISAEANRSWYKRDQSLPRTKRPRTPSNEAGGRPSSGNLVENNHQNSPVHVERPANSSGKDSGNFANNPFAQLAVNR